MTVSLMSDFWMVSFMFVDRLNTLLYRKVCWAYLFSYINDMGTEKLTSTGCAATMVTVTYVISDVAYAKIPYSLSGFGRPTFGMNPRLCAVCPVIVSARTVTNMVFDCWFENVSALVPRLLYTNETFGLFWIIGLFVKFEFWIVI